jgi:hypothetical protein
MNTVFTIITAAIVVGVILMLTIMVISDRISNKRREKRLAEYDAKQRRLNNLVKGLRHTLTGGRRGFIKCEYAFGRFYIDYECITDTGVHYSITESFYDTGIQREKYRRVGTNYGFYNDTDAAIYAEIKADMLSIINKYVN